MTCIDHDQTMDCHIENSSVGFRCLEAVSRGIGVSARQWKHSSNRTGSLGSDSDLCILIEKADHKLTGHTGAILSMVLDSEGKRLFSSSADGSIKVDELPSIFEISSCGFGF